MKKFFIFVIFYLIGATMNASNDNKNFPISDFSTIVVDAPIEISIYLGDRSDYRVEGDRKSINCTISGDVLFIKLAQGEKTNSKVYIMTPKKDLKIKIMPKYQLTRKSKNKNGNHDKK